MCLFIYIYISKTPCRQESGSFMLLKRFEMLLLVILFYMMFLY
jgi:hypothetical protein